MKNPIQNLFKEWHLDSEMYAELTKIRKKFDKEFHAISKKFSKEITALEKKAKGKKVKIEEEITLWKKGGYEKTVRELKKKADGVIKELKAEYKTAMDKLKK